MNADDIKSKYGKWLLSAILHLLIAVCVAAIVYGGLSLHRFGAESYRGAKIYYDAAHGARHLWNRDNRRYRSNYHTVSGFRRFCTALTEEGFNLYVENYRGFDRSILDKYDVFFVGEQTYHSRFMTARQRKDLLDWVRQGGGLFALVEHTNAHYMAEVFNQLFKDLPVKVRNDSICDINQPGPVSPSWVDIPIVKNHPVTKGVCEYRFFNGGSFDTPWGVLFSSKSSWSDKYNKKDNPIHNGNKKHDPDELSGPLAAAAAFEYGKGRIVVLGDHNAMSNPTIYWGDHYRFVTNCMKWLAGDRFNRDVIFLIAGTAAALCLFALRVMCKFDKKTTKATAAISIVMLAAFGLGWYQSRPKYHDFLVHTGNEPAMKYMTKKSGGFFSFYGQLTKEPQLRPWASKNMKRKYEALFLSAPTKCYSVAQLAIIDSYLAGGKTVVYIATVPSLQSRAGRQLQDKFGFKVKIDNTYKQKLFRQPMNVHGLRKWTEGIFRCYIYRAAPPVKVEGIQPIVTLTSGGFHISEEQWLRDTYSCDLLSEKQAGKGRFMLLAPAEVFNDLALKNLYENADVVREQMAELVIRLAKYACRDSSPHDME